MNVQITPGLAITWSTIINLFSVIIFAKHNWSKLTGLGWSLQYAVGWQIRLIVFVIIIGLISALFFVILIESLSLEIAHAILWWVLLVITYGIFSYAGAGTGLGYGALFDKENLFGLMGYFIGCMLGILVAVPLATTLIGLTAGSWIGIALAVPYCMHLLRAYFKTQVTESQRQLIDKIKMRKVTRIRSREYLARRLSDFLKILLGCFVLNLIIVNTPHFIRIVSNYGYLYIFSNLKQSIDWIFSSIPTVVYNTAIISGIVILSLNIFEFFALKYGKHPALDM